ncbi:MAG: UbiA family prenyltransferase [Planctomycetota bacterium]
MNRIIRYRLSSIAATVSLCWWAIQVVSPVESTAVILVVIASATWVIYPLDPILDPRDRGPGEGLRSWTTIRLSIAILVFVIALFFLTSEARTLASIGLPLAALYAVPFSGIRIKDRSAAKIPFIALAITTACVGIPWLQSNASVGLDLILLVTAMILLVISNVIVCDFRDRGRDELAGLKTLASTRPHAAIKITRLLFMMICFIAWIIANEPKTSSLGQALGLLLATLMLHIASKKSQQPILMTLLADGSMALPALFGMLLNK